MGIGVLGLVVGVARYVTARRLQRTLERLELQRALERDRGRIARDIHDGLGAGLTQITLLSGSRAASRCRRWRRTSSRSPTPPASSRVPSTRSSGRSTRRQDTLDGLVAYSCQFAQEYLTMAGIQCRLDVPDHLPAVRLAADVRHNLFLAVKEALTNIVRHAAAREVWLRLMQDRGSITLVIEDDGHGFAELTAAISPGRQDDVWAGLDNLAARLTTIGGRCSISSQPGRGTRVELTVGIA